MMRRLERSEGKVVGYSLSDEISDQEFTQAASQLKDDIAREGTIRVLFRLRDLSLSSFTHAVQERFQFLTEHAEDIERVAVVTDDTATKLLGDVADFLPDVETQTYSHDDETEAWAWLE